MIKTVPDALRFSVMSKPSFPTLTQGWDQEIIIRGIINLTPDDADTGAPPTVFGQTEINAAIERARKGIYEIDLQTLDSSLGGNIVQWHESAYTFLTGTIYTHLSGKLSNMNTATSAPMKLVTGDWATPNHPPGDPYTTVSTEMARASGYGVVHVPRDGLEAGLPNWWIFAQRNIYRFQTDCSYKVSTIKGYFHAGHSTYFGFLRGSGGASEIPMEGILPALHDSATKTAKAGQLIDIPFPSPENYGYPIIDPTDPYMVGVTSIYQATTGICNVIRFV